jgi:hypothetical protein
MKLSLVLYQLRHGGLKQLSDIDKTDEIVVSHINMAVLKLYGRFLLEVKEAIITLQDNKVLYALDSTDVDVLVNDAPITDDTFNSILNVFSDAGEVSVNNEYDEFSVFTPTYNTIQVPTALTGNFISVLYRTTPEFLLFETGDSTDVSIKLPLVLLEPLIHYTAYLAHSSVTSGVDTESHSYYMKYEASCKAIELSGLLTTNSSELDYTANSKGLFL